MGRNSIFLYINNPYCPVQISLLPPQESSLKCPHMSLKSKATISTSSPPSFGNSVSRLLGRGWGGGQGQLFFHTWHESPRYVVPWACLLLTQMIPRSLREAKLTTGGSMLHDLWAGGQDTLKDPYTTQSQDLRRVLRFPASLSYASKMKQ